MRVALGSDHGGFPLKQILAKHLADSGHEVLDCGTHSTDAVDYPDFAVAVGEKVRTGEADLGVMVDGAGIGSAMAANRLPGVLAAVCNDHYVTKNARAHNNANVMTLGSMVVGTGLAKELVSLFLATKFEGGRHEARVNKIHQISDRAGRLAPETVRRVVEEIVRRVAPEIASAPASAPSPASSPASAPAARRIAVPVPAPAPRPAPGRGRRVISADDVRRAKLDGAPLVAPRGAIVTPLARETAQALGVTITQEA